MQHPPAELVAVLEQFGQSHLLRWWDELEVSERERLVSEIETVDFDRLKRLYDEKQEGTDGDRADRAQMPANLVTSEGPENAAEWAAARERGRGLLASGRVGVILVAGGQGTRLGFPHPKGMFPIGPVSGNTLFQFLAEQLLAVSSRAGVAIPYYIMTSDATHDETVKFFQENDFFGLGSERVTFFRQGNMPAVDAATGQILLAEKHAIAQSPDGHGGLLQALVTSGALAQMEVDGIELLYYHQVDNPTAIVADPAFLGFHAQFGSELSTKVVRKRDPSEKMGVLVDVDGATQIIEYSELTPEQSAREDADGNWIFWAGNTAIHIFDREFLARVARSDAGLPFHRARKNVPCVDETGVRCEPDDPADPNAIKFERFIFDALPMAENALVVETDRAREFNPVKNSEGNDSPETARAALSRIGHEWLRRAGQDVAADAIVEISPLVALEADDVRPVSVDVLTGEVLLRPES